MPKYGHGGTPGTPFMTIFGIYVSTHIPNIENFRYMGVYKSREASHRFTREISCRMAPELCLGIHFRSQL